jgi:CheY-like chemotaxis protein
MPQGGTLRIAATNRRLDEEQAGAFPDARPGAWLAIEIADTGTGIAPDVLEHIWDPFFTTKAADKGTGLGLSTVRGIIASHQGFVTVDTKPGLGTTFRVFLPATGEISVDNTVTTASTTPAGKGECILVVDDNAAVRETVAAILARHNYLVLIANDGVEAVNHITMNIARISLVITDVDMPYLSGTALTRILARLRPELRMLVISGLPDDQTERSVIESAENPTNAFLLKPFTPEVLLETVGRLLNSSEKT